MDFKLATFSKALHTNFQLQVEGNDFPVELVEAVDELEGKDVASGRESFSLIFRGDHPEPLNQSTYSCKHEDLGSFDIFLVPIKRDDKGIYYQAIFNSLGEGGS